MGRSSLPSRLGAEGAQLLEGPGIYHFLSFNPASSCSRDAKTNIVEHPRRVGIAVDYQGNTGFFGAAAVGVFEVHALGIGVDFKGDLVFEGGLDDAIEVDGVGVAHAQPAAGEVADCVNGAAGDGLDDAFGHRLFTELKDVVDAGDDEIELGEDIGGIVEAAVAQDIDLRAREDLNTCDRFVGPADVFDVRFEAIDAEAIGYIGGEGVVGDADILVAELEGGLGHLLDSGGAIACLGVHMEVAPELLGFDQCGQC